MVNEIKHVEQKSSRFPLFFLDALTSYAYDLSTEVSYKNPFEITARTLVRNDRGRVPHSCTGEGEDYVLFS